MSANNKDCAFLFLSESCDLACEHCYVSAQSGVGQMMPIPTVIRSFEIFSGLGIQDIRLTGGEPTMHSKLNAIVAKAISYKFCVGLVTNGTRLLKMSNPDDLLMQLSRCWVSVYGPSEEIHTRIGRNLAPTLDKLIKWIGRFAEAKYTIGLSVLLTPGSTSSVLGFLKRVYNGGIHRLRFIPLQPDGKSAIRLSYDWSMWPIELSQLYNTLRTNPLSEEFEVLTLNDLFDIEARFPQKVDSCLLNHRRMWSVVPNGDIYPCCFTVYQTNRKVGNIWHRNIINKLHAVFVASEDIIPCRAFDKSFWPCIPKGRATCSISNIDCRVRR